MVQLSAHDDFHQQNVEDARSIAQYLDHHGAGDALALDISQQSSIADAFVIASAGSMGQLRGLYRRAHEITGELNLSPRQSHKRDDESGWLLVDCDGVVIHLMIQELRQFYELEKLWYDATVIFPV